MLFSAVNVLLFRRLKIDQEVKHSMEIQKCLLPLFNVLKSAQCTDVQSKLHSIWEQNDLKTNLLQLSSFTNLSSKLSQKQLDALIKLIAVHVTQSVLANRDKKISKSHYLNKSYVLGRRSGGRVYFNAGITIDFWIFCSKL